MQQNNIQPFYVGQRVVAVENSNTIAFKKGDEKVILGLLYHCGQWLVDVGTRITGYTQCERCNAKVGKSTIHYAYAYKFAPITSQFQSITLTKILETETPLVGVN